MTQSSLFRLYAVRVSALLGLLWCSSCNVYNPDLVRAGSSRGAVRDSDAGDADASEYADGCGDGVVGEGEECDIAIARGKPGACPDGCSGGEACERNVLDGTRCNAHCIVIELTEPESGDGCCPPDTDYFDDNDCDPHCGNGHLEPGEMCDPAETCPSEDACKSEDACLVANWQGAADSCDARCDMTRIRSCVPGDGCCPAGCNHDQDSDCPVCPEGQSCPVTQVPAEEAAPAPEQMVQKPPPAPPPPPPPPAFVCANAHSGSACAECDCAKCGAQVEDCLADEKQDAMFCKAGIDCGEANHCDTDRCYCGNANADSCTDTPKGVCLPAFEAAARTTVPSRIAYMMRVGDYTVHHIASLLDCREKNCAKECNIKP